MGTFLMVIGLIALAIFIKFIYDSYLTNNTNRRWNEYKTDEPEKAARIENNKGLNFNMKANTNNFDKERSLVLLANKHNCSTTEVKEIYLKDLINNGVTLEEAESFIKNIRQNKYTESLQLKVDPEDTPSSFLEKWTQEYILDITRAKNELKNILRENPDLLDMSMDLMLLKEDPADYYLTKAVDKVVYEKDFYGAIPLIEKGLEVNNEEKEQALFCLRAECYLKTNRANDAIIDYQNAIKSLLKKEPDNYEILCGYYFDIFNAYLNINDLFNAELYIDQALILSEKIESPYYKYKSLENRGGYTICKDYLNKRIMI